MVKLIEYRPCPFCNYPFVGKIQNGETLIGMTHIACASCEAQVIGGNFDTAVKMWNTRPIEDELRNHIAKGLETQQRVWKLRDDLMKSQELNDAYYHQARNDGDAIYELQDKVNELEEMFQAQAFDKRGPIWKTRAEEAEKTIERFHKVHKRKVIQAGIEAEHRIADGILKSVENVKHNSHVDGLGMGFQILENMLIEIANKIKEPK
jgi:hypothetical protein